MNELNTDIVLAIFVATIVLLLLSTFGIVFTVIYKKKQQAFSIEKKMLQARFREELLKAELEIHEDALKQLAHELHDNIGQIASIIKINLVSIQLEEMDKAKQKVAETLDLTRHMINDIKTLSASLNGDRVAQLGIIKCIENEVNRIQRTGQFQISFEVSPALPPLDDKSSIILFRMFQEILNNAVSHSEASHISVRLIENEKKITLSCRDKGRGFDVAAKLGSGSGLMNLKNRAKVIGAELNFESKIGTGTLVTIDLKK